MLSAGAILWLGQYTDIDMVLARGLYDQAGQRFPWRHHWFAEGFNHGVLKVILVTLAAGVIAAAIGDLLRARRALASRWRVRVVALSALLVPLIVTLLKRLSASHCPWDLQQFGGAERYVRLLETVSAGAPAGHCMPGGHASSAMWLVSVAVFWLPHRPCMAALVAAIMLAFGGGVGWVQQMRGAHFLTHTLWTMWIACAVVSVLYALMPRPTLGEQNAA